MGTSWLRYEFTSTRVKHSTTALPHVVVYLSLSLYTAYTLIWVLRAGSPTDVRAGLKLLKAMLIPLKNLSAIICLVHWANVLEQSLHRSNVKCLTSIMMVRVRVLLGSCHIQSSYWKNGSNKWRTYSIVTPNKPFPYLACCEVKNNHQLLSNYLLFVCLFFMNVAKTNDNDI